MRKTVSACPVPPPALRALNHHIPVIRKEYGICIILCALLGAFLYGETDTFADDYDSAYRFEEGYVTAGDIQILHHNTIGLRCDRELHAESGETSLLLSYPSLFAASGSYQPKLQFYRAPSGQVQDQDSRALLFSGTHDGLVWDDILHTVSVTAGQEGVYEL